jgi:cytochrome c2
MAYRLVKSSISTAIIALLLFANFSVKAVDEAQFNHGKKLFKSNCASCHNKYKDMTGPSLVNISERIPSDQWFTDWVKNNVALRNSGDAYANEIYNKWNKASMNTFPALKDEDMAALLVFLNNEDPAAPAAGAATGPDPCETESAVKDAKKGDGGLSLILWIGIAVLVIAAIAIARIGKRLSKVANAIKDGDDVEAVANELRDDKFDLKAMLTQKSVLVPVIILFLCFAGSKAYNFHSNLGRQHVYGSRDHGYKPDQPIAFSHKIHAGINKIECQYCHSSARQNKVSMVPSLMTCLNCHKAIDEYSSCDDVIFTGGSGTEEIHKIYDYLGLDPKTKEKVKEETPIEWVRIHNLPEHVYFNHAQHVVAGKIECQECHGPIEEMDVVEQHSPLSMGWCVNCHRETEVKFTTNDFYEDYKDIHEKLQKGELDKVTVETIGGTDCQRCHY